MSLKTSLNKPLGSCVDEKRTDLGLAHVQICLYCPGHQSNSLTERDHDIECPWRPGEHIRPQVGWQIKLSAEAAGQLI